MATPIPFCRITRRCGDVLTFFDPEDAWAYCATLAAHDAFFIGVVGSRRRNTDADPQIVHDAIAAHGALDDTPLMLPIVVVSGACPQGADRMAAIVARTRGMTLVEFPAQWDLYGSTGPNHAANRRNEHIARLSDVLYALNIPGSPGGTDLTIRHAERLGRPIHLL